MRDLLINLLLALVVVYLISLVLDNYRRQQDTLSSIDNQLQNIDRRLTEIEFIAE